MDNKRNCIFHIPNHIDQTGTSGSQLRPRKMMEAFEKIGYNVDVVMGYGAERKEQIKSIKSKIKQGVKYDFLYAENSTMPNILTEKNHIPRYPFLDYNFFRYCKKNNIPIGLFYRDVHWKKDDYGLNLSRMKYHVAINSYKYELYCYKKVLDRMYLPNKKSTELFKGDLGDLINKVESLPPGGERDEDFLQKKSTFYRNRLDGFDNKLKLFYVGGVGGHYKCVKLLEAIKTIENVSITICCGEEHWREYEKEYKPYLTDRVRIVHETAENLGIYYEEADICVAFFEPTYYMSLAMPIKVFEYISKGTPIIASKGNAYSTVIENNSIGWTIDYSTENLHALLTELCSEYSMVYEKHTNTIKIIGDNTWDARARQVAEDMMSTKHI